MQRMPEKIGPKIKAERKVAERMTLALLRHRSHSKHLRTSSCMRATIRPQNMSISVVFFCDLNSRTTKIREQYSLNENMFCLSNQIENRQKIQFRTKFLRHDRPYQGLPCRKTPHRISGYLDINDINRILELFYQEKNDQISVKYLIGFSRILKITCWIYPNLSQILVDSGQTVKKLRHRWKQPCFDRIQQPDIKDINRISAGNQGLLYTGYHELPPPPVS